MKFKAKIDGVYLIYALLFISLQPVPLVCASEIDEAIRELKELASSLRDKASRWQCVSNRAFQCSQKGCQENSPTITVKIDFTHDEYKRCDHKGCDTYMLTSETSGMFTTITLLGHSGTFFKALNDGREYTEVASLHTNLFMNFGSCQAQALP